MKYFPGRVGIIQRMLPAYRAPFFEALAEACSGGLCVFAGQPVPVEAITAADHLHKAKLSRAKNRNFFPITSPIYVCWQSGLVKWLEDWQPDVLVAEANSRYISTRQAVRWMHARRRPVLGWGLGEPEIEGPFARLRQWNRSSFLRGFDGMIAYSATGAEQYRQLGFSPGKVFVAPNAVAPRPAAPPPPRAVRFTGRPVVLFVGRLQVRKRIDLLLQACAGLPQDKQPNLIIVGDGPDRVFIEASAREIYPQAEFTGALHGAELEAYYQKADLFVLPGTGGLAVQQAMAHALPVIVAEADGTQEDLVQPSSGWLVPPGDLQALSTALEQALADPARLRKMGQAAYQIVAEEINLDRMVSAFIRALNSVVSDY